MEDVLPSGIASRVRFDAAGLLPAVIRDATGHGVLMVGYMNDVALARTLTSGRVWFWSRSRQEYWRKGDTSGHIQLVRRVQLDCDGDCVLVDVIQVGAACHTGTRSCFDAGGDLPITGLIEEEQ
ncbi:MAG: phosphoribosyl-AMP cyclohydrolase [Actinomycetaceae bacterium]|nr:phosphoribosyl-AMP cyclohydrolase [Actinomycetaceae bacterium]